MGDVHEGGVDALAELDDLGAHFVSELCVEVAERLVHEHDLRITHDGAADGDALALAAGERLGLALEVLGDVKDLGRLAHLLVDHVLRLLAELQGEGHVFIHGHVGVEGVVLENHGDVAVLGGHVVHDLTVDDELAAGDLFQTCHHAQGSGLAAAGGADKNDEFLVRNVQVKGLHRDNTLIGDLEVYLFLLGLVRFLLVLFLLAADEGVDFLNVLELYSRHAF